MNRQPTIDELFDRLDLPESNKETYKEDEIVSKNVNILDIEEKRNEKFNSSDKFVKVIYKNATYITWKVEFIRPLIINFLKSKYPNSIIVPLNDIDLVIIDKNEIIPIEIQKATTMIYENSIYFGNSVFEDRIRRQVEDNIENYGKCWLFFDFEYFIYLQSENVSPRTSMNMTWLIELMKKESLKIFVIRYDGEIKELTTKDFDFLKNISHTCKVGYDNDERVLNRNKLKIYRNVIFGYNFTHEEINKFEDEFNNCENDNIKISSQYFKKSDDKRCKVYGNVLISLQSLPTLDIVLSCNVIKKSYSHYGIPLGIFEQNDFTGHDSQARIQFVDKFNVAQYFPGYLRNKEMWDYCKRKQRSFSMSEFIGIVTGTFNYEFIKKQSTMLDY